MLIENIMYVALGALAAGLLALIVMPAVWRRAVRLTKKRIEAATPMTMAEFRADKDQLRAEFALSTRRLEMTIERLRQRLADQLGESALKEANMAAVEAEREKTAAILAEFEARETELRTRALELEKDGADLAQRLRMRERELGQRNTELAGLRDALRGGIATDPDEETLSGEYDADIDRLSLALISERKRVLLLENQAKSLIERLEASDRRSEAASAAIAEMREALNRRHEPRPEEDPDLIAAEASIANAGNRLNALLAETAATGADEAGEGSGLLAERLGIEDQVEALHRDVGEIEAAILADWDTSRADPEDLRARLGAVALGVGRLVHTPEPPAAPREEESLFERVQRFAGEGLDLDTLPSAEAEPEQDPEPRKGKSGGKRAGQLTARMAALREIQGS